MRDIFHSSEGSDRRTLAFSDADNAMVSAVAKAQKNTIVVMVNPGAVLTPWADDVAAALTMFMPGLVTRNAALSTPIWSALVQACVQTIKRLRAFSANRRWATRSLTCCSAT